MDKLYMGETSNEVLMEEPQSWSICLFVFKSFNFAVCLKIFIIKHCRS